MSTILEKLKLYYKTNSAEQIKNDWAEFEKYDEIGPTIDEFMEQTIFHEKHNYLCLLNFNSALIDD